MENIIEKLEVLKEFYETYDFDEIECIADGFKSGLTPKQIALYADKKFRYSQMATIREALEAGLSEEQISVIANSAFGFEQMEKLQYLFEMGVDINIVKMIAVPEDDIYSDSTGLGFEYCSEKIFYLRNNHILHGYSKMKIDPKRLPLILELIDDGYPKCDIDPIVEAEDFDTAFYDNYCRLVFTEED